MEAVLSHLSRKIATTIATTSGALSTLIMSAKAADLEAYANPGNVLTRLRGLPVVRTAEFTPRTRAASRPR